MAVDYLICRSIATVLLISVWEVLDMAAAAGDVARRGHWLDVPAQAEVQPTRPKLQQAVRRGRWSGEHS
jgi:hypothetical protein